MTGETDDRPDVPVIDPTKPSVARAYSYLLGGKDHYEADRKILDLMRQTMRDPETIALTNRRWLIRAVRWLADHAGIAQFIDCGSGLPSNENVHEVAQRYQPGAKVVYIDNDPTVQAHGRALLEENEHTAFVGADLSEPEQVLENPTLRNLIDFDRPVALIQCATLHHVSDEPRPVRDIMATYTAALPRGSYLALTHVLYPPEADDPDGRGHRIADELKQRVHEVGMNSGHWRTYKHVLSFFDGLEMVPPGLVRAAQWYPDGPPNLRDIDRIIYGGIGKKV